MPTTRKSNCYHELTPVKMLLELLSIDYTYASVVIEAWKEMVGTTASRD